jgi:hypothetical protein
MIQGVQNLLTHLTGDSVPLSSDAEPEPPRLTNDDECALEWVHCLRCPLEPLFEEYGDASHVSSTTSSSQPPSPSSSNPSSPLAGTSASTTICLPSAFWPSAMSCRNWADIQSIRSSSFVSESSASNDRGACFGLVIATGPGRFREVGPGLVRLRGLCLGMLGLCESEESRVNLSGCSAYPKKSVGSFGQVAS